MSSFDYTSLWERPPVIEEIILKQKENSLNQIDILRLDLIHPMLSGNKIFKLSLFLSDCLQSNHRTLLTFGGAFSNHLSATAYACRTLGIKCIGLVRGEILNTPTLKYCQKMGMELHGMERSEFRKISEQTNNDLLISKYGPHTLVPLGGFGKKGANGAMDIMNLVPENTYSHICTPVGSGTTLAGLLLKSRKETIVAFPAIKNMHDIPNRMLEMGVRSLEKLSVVSNYHFGGFAKRNDELIKFINQFYRDYQIPLDMVYTSKMLFGVIDMIQNGEFPHSSKILCIHTGGLQGNQSLPAGTLCF